MLGTLPLKREGLTPFSYSRFLCPYLCGYVGHSLYLDVDMLLRSDICELLELASDDVDVQVVKGGLPFEWPSLMLFNNGRCRFLTPEFIERSANPFDLKWARTIGNLPPEWNHCVGYDQPRSDAKLVHFTQGVPYFPETERSEYTAEWRQALEDAIDSQSWETLMGQSVHKQQVAGSRC